MRNFKHGWVLGLLLLAAITGRAQESALTIDQCYELARQNYPLITKHDLIACEQRVFH